MSHIFKYVIIVLEEDIIRLILPPLMSGNLSQKERIKKAIKLIHEQETIISNANKLEAVIYAMASKFLDNTEFNEIKEAVKMTELGTFIYNDGKLEGKKEDARDFFLNGADFELVKNSIKDLTEDVLREIYDEVMALKNND